MTEIAIIFSLDHKNSLGPSIDTDALETVGLTAYSQGLPLLAEHLTYRLQGYISIIS